MGFVRKIAVIPCMFVVSMFYFPFEFRALPPGMNTKKVMAAVALVLLLFRMVYRRDLTVSKDFLYLSVLASLVSFCGIVSVTYNNTDDYAYATYITSAWVWWGAAYTACQCIRWVHGRLTWRLVVNYLVAVCVFQCVLALAMDDYRAVKLFVNSFVLQGDMVFEGGVRRLYGIGASLDVAGMRFAAVLVMIIYLLANADVRKRWYDYLLLLLSFIIITVAGNIMARTTIVGVVVGLVYLVVLSMKQTLRVSSTHLVLWRWLGGLLVFCVPLLVVSYQTDAKMRERIRFGFEGFFSLVEKGRFSYTSNERLGTMFVWPDNVKTWLVGDGYFSNPVATDAHYTGEITSGYYMGTDVGYLRFIFYFGMVGLLMFSFFMLKVGQVCIRKFPHWKVLFLMLLAVHFIVWAKVSTDIFLVFALFLCLDNNEDPEKNSIITDYETTEQQRTKRVLSGNS